MASFPPGLVWLASFPKSGNTWMRVLLANLLAGSETPVDINYLPEDEAIPVNRQQIINDTLVDPDVLTWQELERMRPGHADLLARRLDGPGFYKTHDAFFGRSGGPMVGTQARAALYLLRDPRDVAVSYAHHQGFSLEASVRSLLNQDLYFGGGLHIHYLVGDWGSHVNGWTEQRLLPIKVVRYEDLRADTVACLTDIVTFLGATATNLEIRRAVAHSDFNELQRQEADKGFRERMPTQDRFFRRGRVGEGREALSPSDIAALEERFAPIMERWGYGCG